MDQSKFNALLQEVIDKTTSGTLVWEKTANAGQFVASIGGQFSVTISGPPVPIGGLIGQLLPPPPSARTSYRVILKGFEGDVLVDESSPDLALNQTFLTSLSQNPKIKELYALVYGLFASREDRALDKVLEALKKLSKP